MNHSSGEIKNRYVAPLSGITSEDLELAGGKGANLGALIQAGFPVPEGFAVTTQAYWLVLTSNHLDKTIREHLQAQDGSETIRSAFEAAIIPGKIEQEILEAYRNLGEGPVAVRSSATAEDLPQAAFAGQQDTYLNVTGHEQLLLAIRRCWASLWSERAISYRTHQGVDQDSVMIAVIVQKLVPADVAGTMFTANPVSGARNEVVIDSSPGLGEAVVSGLVTPDHYLVQVLDGNLKIAERKIGRREVIVEAIPEGGVRQISGEITGDQPYSLEDKLLLSLVRKGLDIQRHFGKPQDIEWAVANREVYILQARPITALPAPLPPANRIVRMLSAMFTEMFPIRPYPLDQTTWLHAISAAAVDPLFKLIGLSVPSLDQFFEEEDGVIVRFNGKIDMHPTPVLLLAPARILVLSLRYDPKNARSDPLLIDAKREAQRLEAVKLEALSWAELVSLVAQASSLAMPLAGEIRKRYYPRTILAAGVLRAILGLMGMGNSFGALFSAPHSATSETNQALETLASRVRETPQLAQQFNNLPPEKLTVELLQSAAGKDFLADFNAFLDRYGHREVALSSVLEPTWKDAPEVVLGILQGMALSQAAEANNTWESAREQLLGHPWLHIPFLRRWILGLVDTARSLWRVREDTHFDATRILPILRRTFLEMGKRLVSVGVLSVPEDIFHLKFDELQGIGDVWPPEPEQVSELHKLVTRRREKRASLEHVPLIDPRLYQPDEQDQDALLVGTPGSPGQAEGRVCVINSAAEFSRLQAGDVLVAPYTNPAWTPLFQRAAAIIVDGGAAGSHAAIVAREYGLPAVLGTINGTKTLVNGQRVRVDGSRGRVYAVEETSGGAQKEYKEDGE